MNHLKFILLVAAAGLLQACIGGTSPESRYYRMTSLLDETTKATPELQQYDMLVGVGPIKIADYLDRPQIVGRSTANTLQLGEFDRWSGSLQDNLEITLTENLQARLGGNKVIAYPWPRAVNPDYHITLRVSRFDNSVGAVVLRVNWLIMDQHDNKMLKLGSSEIHEPVTSNDYNDQVAANSRAIVKLSNELILALREIVEAN